MTIGLRMKNSWDGSSGHNGYHQLEAISAAGGLQHDAASVCVSIELEMTLQQ